jgi:opacity protein-like surface antigen
MKKQFLVGITLNALISAPSMAADLLPLAPRPSLPLFSWTGFYAGVTAGGAWGSYDPQTSTIGGDSAEQAAAITGIGHQKINPIGFATGMETGYNWQNGAFLIGFEADLQAVHLNGTANSSAILYPGPDATGAFVVSSYGNSNWLFTARPRVGWVAPNNWLLYATGGLAVTQLNSDFVLTDTNGLLESAKANTGKAGYAVGGGVEVPLSGWLSLKAEYLFAHFGRTNAPVTSNTIAVSSPNQIFSHSADLTANIARVGLNYRFFGGDARTPAITPLWAAVPFFTEWEIETGARLWFSSGKLGAPQPLLNVPGDRVASRLIYANLDAYSGESFARIDHTSGFFVKGFLGAGGIGHGKLDDEDFPSDVAYSDTLSSASGHLGYANIDAGYTFLRAPGAKLGAFAGYNYYTQSINTYGCTQLASDTSCAPSGTNSPNFLIIANNSRLNSMRLGLSAQFMLTDRLRFTADAAYLPLVNFKGQDDHNARELLLPQSASGGDGVMIEGILGYDVTEAWNVGLGARYWAWNTRTGTTIFNNLTNPAENAIEPARFTSERYGAFLQTSYRWGTTPKAAEDGVAMPIVAAAAPMNWTGLYVGGHMGGGWSNDHWFDPFGPTLSEKGGLNAAGFGDITHGTGPLGGGQIGFNWQTGPWVFGLQADASGADLHGENTCFSGLGGVNCQRVVNALGTLAGRVGYGWNRSLVYVKSGGAWANTAYSLNANTNALTLGSGTTRVNEGGWTIGGGIEYAFTDHWTVLAEYDHIGMPGRSVSFPTIADGTTISVRQSIEIFKLGMNYKFDFAGPAQVVAKY